MNVIEARVNEFLTTWNLRKSGELPAVDLKVSCCKCATEIMGDDRVEYSIDGLVCTCCLIEAKVSTTSKR